MKDAKRILLINGSIRGDIGNSGKVAAYAIDYFNKQGSIIATTLTLTSEMPAIADVYALLEQQDALLVITGNYWNNYGSPLQRFIEVFTAYENTPCFFGKPVACVVSMDSVGGTDIAARIHSVFSGLGCWSPPCSTLVLSRVGQEAIAASKGIDDDANEDVWHLEDMDTVLKNLLASTGIKAEWEHWPHVQLKAEGQWPRQGNLDMDSPKFL